MQHVCIGEARWASSLRWHSELQCTPHPMQPHSREWDVFTSPASRLRARLRIEDNVLAVQRPYLPATYCSTKGPRLRQGPCGPPPGHAEIQDLAFPGALIIIAVSANGQKLMVTHTAG